MFTPAELRLIERAVESYIAHPEVVDLLISIKAKLRTQNQLDEHVSTMSGMVNRLPDGTEIIIPERQNTPAFYFLDAPSTLNLSTVLPRGARSSSDVTLSYLNYCLRVAVPRTTFGQMAHTLTSYETEALLAYLIYNRLKERGIDRSGIQPKTKETDKKATRVE